VNWVVFLVCAWAAMGLEQSLKGMVALNSWNATVSPSFALILAVWIAMNAPPQSAAWACLILGLLVDLTARIPLEPGGVLTVAGPNALALLVASQFVLSARWLMIRRNPVALALLTLPAGLIATVVSAVPFALRRLLGDAVEWHTGPELLGGFGSAAYSSLVALPMALGLNLLTGPFGFHGGSNRVIPRRGYERW
jgi:hypothetical protein